MERPLISITLAVIAGMILAAAAGHAGFFVAMAAGLVCVGCLIWRGVDSPLFKYVLLVWFGALGLAWSLLAQQTPSVLYRQLGKEVAVTGEIQEVKPSANTQVLTVRLLQLQSSVPKGREYFRAIIFNAQPGEYREGQIIRVTGRPEAIRDNGNPGIFSYRDYLFRQRTYTQIRVRGKPEVLGQGGSWLDRAVAAFRARTMQLAAGVMGERQAGIFQGIVFGGTDGLSPVDKEVFSTTGVLHAFAVSGSNVAFVFFLGSVIFNPLPKKLALGLTGLMVAFYCILTGAQGPVVRASIMALVTLGGQALSRKGDALNSLALAALVMLIYDPNYLTDPGFQLSFAATWGLVELVPRLGLKGLPGAVREVALLPVAAQLATLPLIAFYFNQVSLIGVAANILVTWFLAVILEVGLAGAGLGLIGPGLGQLLLAPLGWLINLTVWILELMARVPGAALWVVKPPVWLVVVYYLGLGAWVYRDRLMTAVRELYPKLRSRVEVAVNVKGSGYLLIAMMLVLLVIAIPRMSPAHPLEVEFLDVGQGDSILISTPGGRHYLIDGGPRTERYDVGKAVVVPYLLSKGVNHLDGVFMTHPHDDHSGGLIETVKTFQVDNFYLPPIESTQESPGLWTVLQDELRRQRVPVVTLRAGARLDLGTGVLLEVLAPDTLFEGSHSDFNNNSLVMGLFYGRQSFLLTGDIEMEALAELRDRLPSNFTVLKIPHHGSKYGLDKEFMDKLSPAAAVVSVGKNNYGQPAPSVIAYWRKRGIPLLRTDQDGQVDIRTDGESLSVYTGRERKPVLEQNKDS